MSTQLSQEQLDLGNQTAIDLFVESNNNKATLAATLANKGTPADASAETWGELLGKTADLNVEAGRALLNVPIVSRTAGMFPSESLSDGSYNIGIAYGRWSFHLTSTTNVRELDLKSASLANYDTTYTISAPNYTDITIPALASNYWFQRRAFITKKNKLVILTNNRLLIYTIDESTGVPTLATDVTLSTSIHGNGAVGGITDDESKVIFIDKNAELEVAHNYIKYITVADGVTHAFSAVPAGTSAHLNPQLYGDAHLIFSAYGTVSQINNDSVIVQAAHFLIDWGTDVITDTLSTFNINKFSAVTQNPKYITSASKKYIPYYNDATYLYCLDDYASAKISDDTLSPATKNRMSGCPYIVDLDGGGYAITGNLTLPIFLDADLAPKYIGFNDKTSCIMAQYSIRPCSNFALEMAIYDEDSQTMYHSGLSSVLKAAKFKVYLNKVAGYSRLHNGITTPFWSNSTEADIEAGALDLVVV